MPSFVLSSFPRKWESIDAKALDPRFRGDDDGGLEAGLTFIDNQVI